MQGGRGSGKTRTGAETLAIWILSNAPGDWGIVAPTYGDARDTCIEGASGLLERLGPAVENWNRSIGEITLYNGAKVFADGADDGALRVQGRNLMGCWADEVGLWREWRRAWEESISFAVRIDPARIIATGTPKRNNPGFVKMLLNDPGTIVTRPSLENNKGNLSPVQVAELFRRYEGTRLGQQELYGEMIDDVEGALWTYEMIERSRAERPDPETIHRAVVAVDPAVTTSAESDETGIVVASVVVGPTKTDGYVTHDLSGRYSPDEWAQVAVDAYYEHHLDRIVAERNQGGDMVKHTIATVDPNVPVSLVWASRGKQARAEPVSALYEQGRIHHCGAFAELEAEQTGWSQGDNSPSRLDALVWALTDLMLARSDAAVIVGMDRGRGITGDLMDTKW